MSRNILGESGPESYDTQTDEQVFLTESEGSEMYDLSIAQKKDKCIRHAINQWLVKGKITNGPFRNLSEISVDAAGIMNKGKRAIVPNALVPTIMSNIHGQCHPGYEVTLAAIRNHFWWKTMHSDIKNFVKKCRTCLQTKRTDDPKAEIQSVIIPNIPREVLSIDLATMPLSDQNNRYFLIMVDMATKFAASSALKDQTAPSISQALWDHWFSKFGLPSILLSDQGQNVDGEVIQRLCKILKIEKWHSTPYHPQGNSTSERTIGTIKSRISAMLHSRKMPVTKWDLVLQEAMLYFNNQMNTS